MKCQAQQAIEQLMILWVRRSWDCGGEEVRAAKQQDPKNKEYEGKDIWEESCFKSPGQVVINSRESRINSGNEKKCLLLVRNFQGRGVWGRQKLCQTPTLKKILEIILGSLISHSNSVFNSIENRYPLKHLKTLASLVLL